MYLLSCHLACLQLAIFYKVDDLVFSSKNQNSLTIACLLIEHIIPCHRVPVQSLSDRGTAFLSKLMKEVYKLLGLKEVNTTAYHPEMMGWWSDLTEH